jgi:hypothetical protein
MSAASTNRAPRLLLRDRQSLDNYRVDKNHCAWRGSTYDVSKGFVVRFDD